MNIQPVTEMKNSTQLLAQMSSGNPVYLTRNGRGIGVLISMEDMEEMERTKAALRFMQEMLEAEREADEKGWLSIEDLREHFMGRTKDAVRG